MFIILFVELLSHPREVEILIILSYAAYEKQIYSQRRVALVDSIIYTNKNTVYNTPYKMCTLQMISVTCVFNNCTIISDHAIIYKKNILVNSRYLSLFLKIFTNVIHRIFRGGSFEDKKRLFKHVQILFKLSEQEEARSVHEF